MSEKVKASNHDDFPWAFSHYQKGEQGKKRKGLTTRSSNDMESAN